MAFAVVLFALFSCSHALLRTQQAKIMSPNRTFRVALYAGEGVGSYMKSLHGALLEAAPALNLNLQQINETSILTELTNDAYDVVVFPGGSGREMAIAIGQDGLTIVRNFIINGGHYIGTCGGAFLALEFLKLIPLSKRLPFSKGSGIVDVEFTPEARVKLGLRGTKHDDATAILFDAGPIVPPEDLPPNITIFAWYRSAVNSSIPFTIQHPLTNGSMINTPAVMVTKYGKGVAILNSMHPEMNPRSPEIYLGELAWALGVPYTPAIVEAIKNMSQEYPNDVLALEGHLLP